MFNVYFTLHKFDAYNGVVHATSDQQTMGNGDITEYRQ